MTAPSSSPSSARPFRRCILHIGFEKTGTTAIQFAMDANRAALFEAGHFMPTCFGGPSMPALAAYAAADDRIDDMRTQFGATSPDKVRAFRVRMVEAFTRELKGVDTGALEVLHLSNEHCHTRLRGTADVKRLRDFLAPYAERFQIVAYLRRQDRLCTSLYSTELKIGGTEPFAFPQDADATAIYRYDEILGWWEEVFGSDAMTVRLYDRKALIGGDILDDYCAAVGLDRTLLSAPGTRSNPSINAGAFAFLRRFNARFHRMKGRRLNPMRGDILRYVEGPMAGKAQGFFDPQEAAAFLAKFDQGNETVRARYFPDQDRLFEPVNTAASPQPPDFDLEGLFLQVWADKTQEIAKLRAHAAYLMARLAMKDEDAQTAERHLRDALTAVPGHAPAMMDLAELIAPDRPKEALTICQAVERIGKGTYDDRLATLRTRISGQGQSR